MAKKQKKTRIRADLVWKFMGDGIWEITLGLMIIWVGMLMLLSWSPIWFLPALLLFLIGFFLKKKYVFPLAKKIQLPRVKSRAAVELGILTLIILIILLSIFKEEPGLMGYWKYIQQNALTMSAILSTIVFFFIAFISKSPHFYLHGILLLLTFFLEASYFRANPLGLPIGAGVVMVISGVVNLRQFLQKKKLE